MAKKLGTFLLFFVIIILLIAGIYNIFFYDTNSDYDKKSSTYSYDSYSKNYTGSTYTYFTNKYGTSTTICAHSGCSNYIATSGDTNCCSVHSNRCKGCYCYIDEDASYCMDCIKKALY